MRGPAERDPGARQARRARDDRDLRSRSHRDLRFRSTSIRNRTARARSTAAQYFARLTQRLISALTAQTNYGALYQVDMRLRPSGRSGPLATQIDGFASYQENEAWTWEHLALTRARVVSASPAFAARVENVIRDVLCRPRDAETIAGDVVEMRARDRDREGRQRPLEPQIRRRRAGRYRVHRAISAARPRRREARHSRHLDRARARQGVAARRAGDRGRRGAAPGGAALSRPDADPAAVPAGAVRSEDGRRRACSACWRAPPTCPTSPRSMRFIAETQAQGARELRAHPRRVALSASTRHSSTGRCKCYRLLNCSVARLQQAP